MAVADLCPLQKFPSGKDQVLRDFRLKWLWLSLIYGLTFTLRNQNNLNCNHLISFSFGFRKCQGCKLRKSVRDGSFFARSKISLQRQTHFLWKWCQKDSLLVMERDWIARRKALIKFARRCREIAWQALLLHPIPRLGGPGVVVQIDESKFNHKSKVGLAHKIIQYILQYIQ